MGQMDMYVKMYDELVRPEGHNPTIGILLCADTDEDVAHYSVLSNNDNLFAAKYLTYMPTQERNRTTKGVLSIAKGRFERITRRLDFYCRFGFSCYLCKWLCNTMFL